MAGHRAVCATALMLLALVTTGEAQTPLLVPGVRVRITGPCLADLPSGPAQCAIVLGRLRSWTPDTVVVQQRSGADRAVFRGDVKRVDVSDGIRSRKLLGTAVGAGVGLAVGFAARCTSEGTGDSQSLDYFGCTILRSFFVPVTTLVGAGLGLFVGSLIRSERWVSLAGDLAHVNVLPIGTSALAVTVGLRF